MTIHRGPQAPELEVNCIAAHLEGLEETIIARLIDRAQFRVNNRIYRSGGSGFEGVPKRSLFHLRLLFQEKMDAQFGRFCVPEERPFFPRLPKSKRKVKLPETGLNIRDFNDVNLMPAIVSRYIGLIPRICRTGDDGHFGSSVEHDVYAVQAIARRIHYGALFVAESKFRADPEAFTRLIRAGDTAAIIARLTRREVEETIVRRIRDKAGAMQSNVNRDVRQCIDPEVIAEFYRESIVSLTKKGEVLYLMNRSGVNKFI
jgi:chorismate mutase